MREALASFAELFALSLLLCQYFLLPAPVHADELPGLARAAFSARIRSDEPVVAERAMYFVMKR